MTLSRIKLEEIESHTLAPYAIRSAQSRGRKYPEEEAAYRTCFQRDRDRIIHTTAFRRLEYKTQVFINYEGDYYRTRLTHTLEVVQIGRTLARALGANEDLVETICLAHDIGHPPFGHSGENALANLMVDHGGFNHNKQSYRIVTHLEKRYQNFPGLNLSWEVLEGIVKHETEYDHADAHDYHPDLRGHLEAQIANAADELAYSTHDLDDGLRSGLLTPSMLQGIDLWEMATNELMTDPHNVHDLMRHQIIRYLVNKEVTDLLSSTTTHLMDNNIKSVDELQRLAYNVVCFSPEMKQHNRQLKDFLYNNLYRQHRVMRMAVKAERIINDLFRAYYDEPGILPRHMQENIQQRGLHRTICDYIAGMTDRFAIEEHTKIFDPIALP